ncbi:hypothetical protein M885DRAFT_531261 [Pelagophyceae sp. CCMP2097]|nr:hypothetical protein M885DRAFT_531261 [Pelagophyceae sp. CCMP2097]
MMLRLFGAVLVCLVAVALGLLRWRPRVANGCERGGDRVFTKADLAARYNGTGYGKPIYMAITGLVYDVTTGSEFYAGEGSYDFFAARDASLAFATGEFQTNLTDDVSSLTSSELVDLESWVRDTYVARYVYKGLLQGHFYDECGRKTVAALGYDRLIALEHHRQGRLSEDKGLFKPCNSKKTRTERYIWCAEPLLPRNRSYLGLDRCACVHPGVVDSQAEASMKLYDDCPPGDSKCPLPL